MERVLACCKHYLNKISEEEFNQIMSAPYDPADFIQKLEEHWLVLLAHQVLGEPGLSDKARTIVLQQLRLKSKMMQITKIFNEQGIPHVHLKGPILNHQLFGEECLRYSSDLDVFVESEQLLLADAALRGLGFIRKESNIACRFHAMFPKITYKKDLTYHLSGWPFLIELHWKMDSVDPLDQRKELSYESCGGLDIPVLKDRYHLVYLCWHGAKHRWSRLRWLLDIALFIQRRQINVPDFLVFSKQVGMQKAVFEALFLLNSCFGFDEYEDIKSKPMSFSESLSLRGKLKSYFKHVRLFPWKKRGWYGLYFMLLVVLVVFRRIKFYIARLALSER